MPFQSIRLFACALAVISATPSWAQDSAIADKFEVTYGMNRSNQSLLNGVLVTNKNDPTINVTYETAKGFASVQNGVGLWLVRNEQVKAGYSINYMMGRYATADTRYNGMGNVAGSAAAYAWGEWQPVKDAVTVYGNYSSALRTNNGALAQWGVTLGVPVVNRVNAFIDVSRYWANQRYIQTYYGVTSAQAGSSNTYSAYTPTAAGTLYSNTLWGAMVEATKDIDVVIGVGKSSATGLLMNSPLLDRKTQTNASVVLNQRFGVH
jgi:outer membrane scaffolding protein for murein synthesis (MipA/OmpV family)